MTSSNAFNWNLGFKRFIFVLILAVITVACQPIAASESTGQEVEPIIIGTSLPLTGRRAEAGKATKQGYETWVAMVNEQGGLLGRQVELLVLDNGGRVETVAADYERLISEDQVELVLGTQASALVIPSSEVADQHGYVYVQPSGGSPDVFNRGLTNLFFAQPAQSSRQADPFALYILSLPTDQRPKTFAVVSNDETFSLSVTERLKGLLMDGGLELMADITYPIETTGFIDIATELDELNPDLLIGGTQLADAIGQILAYQQLDYQPRYAFFTSGPALPEPFRNTLGLSTEGIFSSVSWYPEGKDYQNADFVAKYLELFGGSLGEIPEDAANAFTVGQVLQQAIENTESIDNATLIEELHRGSYETIVGSLSFDETGAPQGTSMLLQWQGENFVIVGPRDRAEADPLPGPKGRW